MIRLIHLQIYFPEADYMGPERLSKIMTCERYFNNFRSTFNDNNIVQRINRINKSSTESEKEFGKFFHNLIQCYVNNVSESNVETYTRELLISQDTERWTDKLIDLLSPHYEHKTCNSFLSSGDAENMERSINHFSELYIHHKLDQFSWECELEIRGFKFDCFSLNGDIDLVGINEEEKRIFAIELKKAQKPYPQWKYQLYLYMLMLQEKYQDYTIFGAIWHPGSSLKPVKMDTATSFIDSIFNGDETNPIRYICDDCKVWDCEDRK